MMCPPGVEGSIRALLASGVRRANRSLRRSDHTVLKVLRHHCGPRANTELGEDASEVRRDGPRADLEHVGNDLVRMAFRDQAGNLLLAGTEQDLPLGRFGLRANDQAAHAFNFHVEDHAVRIHRRLAGRR